MTKQFFNYQLFIKQWVRGQKRFTIHKREILYDLKRKTIFKIPSLAYFDSNKLEFKKKTSKG